TSSSLRYADSGRSPTSRPTSWPPRNARTVGTEETPRPPANSRLAPASTFSTLARPSYSPASLSMTGASCRQGPQCSPYTSSSTRTGEPTTSDSYSDWLISRAMIPVLSCLGGDLSVRSIGPGRSTGGRRTVPGENARADGPGGQPALRLAGT